MKNNRYFLFRYSVSIIACSILFVTLFSCGMSKEEKRKVSNKGIELFYAGKYEEAIAIFNKLLKDDSNNSEIFYYRGSSWFNLRDTDKAIKDFNQAISLNPRYADAYSTRGDIYFYLGDKDKACKDYREADKLGKPNMRDKIRFCP